MPYAVNVDIEPRSQTFVHDLEKGLPFADNSFEKIYCISVLEHIHNLDSLIKHIYRVAKNGCIIEVRTPALFNLFGMWSDPSHRRPIEIDTFMFYNRQAGKIMFKRLDKKYHLLKGIIPFPCDISFRLEVKK
jgi:ubiquinone/menaquinone biosynthesis C-methylase UbiE